MFSTALKLAAVAALFVGGQAFAEGVGACRDGEQLLMPSENYTESGSLELRTCVNGSFYPRSNVKLGPVCEEGQTYLMPGDTTVEGAGFEFRTCTNGRLYPRTKAPAVRGCTEGERLLLPDPRTSTSETQQLVEQVCRRGVFVPLY